jgi:hypothetical protein
LMFVKGIDDFKGPVWINFHYFFVETKLLM